MKKLMFAMVAAISFVAMAQEGGPMAEGQGGQHRGPRAGTTAQRGVMPRNMIGGEMMGADPAVMAVMNPKIAEKIGIPQETREQIRKIDLDNRAKVKELQNKTRVAMEKQAKLMKAEKIDEAAVMSTIDELFDCRKEMAKAQTKRVIAMKSLLTPEQLTKATEEMKLLRESRRSKRQGGNRGQMSGGKPEGGPQGGPQDGGPQGGPQDGGPQGGPQDGGPQGGPQDGPQGNPPPPQAE